MHKPYPDSGRQAQARGGPTAGCGNCASKSGQRRRFHGKTDCQLLPSPSGDKKIKQKQWLARDFGKASGSSDSFAAKKPHNLLFLLIILCWHDVCTTSLQEFNTHHHAMKKTVKKITPLELLAGAAADREIDNPIQ